MKKCESCNIKFNTSSKLCPLCQNKLIGNMSSSIYPKNVRRNTYSLILKIVIFVSLVSAIISTFIELYIFNDINYNVYVYLGLVTNYSIIYFIMRNSKNVFKMFFKYGVLLIFLTFIWYYFTRVKFIVNYIIPSIGLLELIFSLMVSLIIRKNYFIKYSNLILINICILIIPIILVMFNIPTNNLMSYICFIVALITIIGLIIFCYDDIKEEVLKIFNL